MHQSSTPPPPTPTELCSTVLPGPDVASPPTQQKSTAIWRKFAAISNFSKIQHTFPLFLVFSYRFAIKINAQFLL
jgi:hypothetical protein